MQTTTDSPDTYGYNYDLVGDGSGFPPFSYPASVQITFKYTANILIGNTSHLPSLSLSCLGALINRRTIITAASCLPTSIPYSYSSSKLRNETISVPVVTNDYYSTLQSIYNVYLAINKNIQMGADVTPTQTAAISQIIIVLIYQN